MGLTLFKHNQAAYEAALALLKNTGKAAVIHPTGTGKSFIAFHLCEEHPGKTVCWLSPSEYIFKTQLENWVNAGGSDVKDISFYTYAKLMSMEEDEISKIKPDYIVLDEFHRCGARMWGQGVRRLLDFYPETPKLGLSATNIRYLDNQRDMADELFDGNIASEMSLGEAIVRGILTPPKYVLSVFSYRKELEKYEARVRSAKSKAVRDAAEDYLEALRRALEKADGLEELFQKHMPDKNGKYIVFCANYEHLCEMVEKAPEWFREVDNAPHIYSVYSENPETDRMFLDFKADTGSHLKLLFCIDMLNEGIHVENVSGVILLRPTVSPIIYKQQIGRVFSANKEKDTVIFDIVLNIENLYGIGMVEDEMQMALTHYQSVGRESEIVNDHFQISGETKDCVRLFKQLNETLSASWELMYESAKDYCGKHGNLEIPKRYVTADGLALGQWLNTQRRVYANKINGILTEEQIEKLNGLGMRWENANDKAWERNFAAAEAYYREHGNLLVKVNGSPYKGVMLGKWIGQLRICRKNDTKSGYLTEERITALDKIGMVWDVRDFLWEQNYESAKQYYREHGNLNVPANYVDADEVHLGAWISEMKAVRQNKGNKRAELTEKQVEKLNQIGMVWESKYDLIWGKSYEAACRYQEEYGNLDIPSAYVTEDGCRLGRWIRRQRDTYGTTLSKERREKLDAIGMVWSIGKIKYKKV